MTVSSLITESREWNQNLLCSSFSPFEINLITELELSSSGGSDKRYWSFEENGKYTVKFGYRVQTGFFEVPSFKSEASDRSWWKRLWKLNVPPKVRIFGWKIFQGFIPVELQLKRRHIPTDGVCWGCKKEWGSTDHTFIFCKLVKPLWKLTDFWPQLSSLRGMSFQDIVLFMFNKLSSHDFELWILLLWFIWGGLCRFKHDNEAFKLGDIFNSAYVFREHFRFAKTAFRSLLPQCERIGSINWSCPPRGCYRLDVDALFNPNMGRFGVGCVVRDCSGKVCFALAKPIARTRSVFEAEFMALWFGVSECFKQKLGTVHAYSDSLLLVHAINERDVDSNLPVEYVRELIERCDQGFLFSFSHVHRSANMVAHGLASFSGTISAPRYWTNSFPSWLCNLVTADL